MLFVVLLLITVLVLSFYIHKFKKSNEKCSSSWSPNYRSTNDLVVVNVIMSCALIILSLSSLFIFALSDITLIQLREERYVLIEQLERIENNEYNVIINGDMGSMSDVYEDIHRFNYRIEVARRYENNLFIGIFITHNLSKLEKIPLGDDYDFTINTNQVRRYKNEWRI